MYTKSGVSGMAYANTFQRMEIKYLLTSQQTEAVLQKISGFMIEDEYSRQTICSLYCDSPDDILARISLDKPVYKEKLRLRAYGTPTDSSPVFLEIKKKYDGVVYKRRVSTDFAQAMRFLTEGIPPESGDYVARQVTAEMTHMIRRDGLIPRAAVFYDRRAFHGADDPELRLKVGFVDSAVARQYAFRTRDTPRLVFKVRLGLQTALSGSLHHIILLWSDSFE